MITFVDGGFDKKNSNATVFYNGVEHDAVATRDDDGNIEVKVDFPMTPEIGTAVTFINRAEDDATYVGTFQAGAERGSLVYQGN